MKFCHKSIHLVTLIGLTAPVYGAGYCRVQTPCKESSSARRATIMRAIPRKKLRVQFDVKVSKGRRRNSGRRILLYLGQS